MITTVIALLVGLRAPQQDSSDVSKQSASQIMSKMFGHYAQAKSVVGTIKMTQVAHGATIHTDTEMQFDRPALIFLHQVRDGSQRHEWYLTSDGKEFSYDPPENRNPLLYGHRRMVEYVTQHSTTLGLPDFLAAASRSLGDVNPMIESSIAQKDRLKRLIGQWATLVYRGKVTVDGQTVDAISGQYREKLGDPITGQFEAYISDSGDFVKYVLKQRLEFPQISKDPIEITTTWESGLKVDAQTNKSLYKVIS